MLKSSLNLLQSITSLAQRCAAMKTVLPGGQNLILKYLHTTSNNRGKTNDMSYMIRKMPKEDEGTLGEHSFDLETVTDDNFPDINLPNRLFNGIPYRLLPICNIRTSPNNTIFSLTNPEGKVIHLYSCGKEGYKNCRKGTNVAAQATGHTFGKGLVRNGYGTVRLRVRGLGPGRLSSIKGLETAGVNIVSVTDFTKVSWFPPRPRKKRRI